MKILLDTNIVIYRESDNSFMSSIGDLYKIIDNSNNMQKYINPIIKNEILQNRISDNRKMLIDRLNSYNMLDNSSRELCDELSSKLAFDDKTVNDKNDSLILNDVYTGKVDLIISEDKKMKEKALKMGIPSKVMNIDEFIFNSKEEKKVNHNILDIKKVKIDTLDINDSFFDSLKSSYPDFVNWINKKKEEPAYCYFEKNKLLALLILKNEEVGDEDYKDIKPNMKYNRKLKISTFKVGIEHKKIGERFMKIIFDQAIYSMVDEIYVTIFDDDEKKRKLINYFEKFGFKLFGKKNEKELVYIRSMKKSFNSEEPLKSYPYINCNNDLFIVPINPQYHTFLLPDSKILNEYNRIVHMPVEYAINKYYISAAGFKKKPKIGDNLVFYRTSEGLIPAKYASVITTIGVVTNIFIPRNIDDLVNKVRNKTVYTDLEIRNYYKSKIEFTYVIEFAYVTTLENKINLYECIKNGILDKAPRGVQELNNVKLDKIIELGGVNSYITI